MEVPAALLEAYYQAQLSLHGLERIIGNNIDFDSTPEIRQVLDEIWGLMENIDNTLLAIMWATEPRDARKLSRQAHSLVNKARRKSAGDLNTWLVKERTAGHLEKEEYREIRQAMGDARQQLRALSKNIREMRKGIEKV